MTEENDTEREKEKETEKETAKKGTGQEQRQTETVTNKRMGRPEPSATNSLRVNGLSVLLRMTCQMWRGYEHTEGVEDAQSVEGSPASMIGKAEQTTRCRASVASPARTCRLAVQTVHSSPKGEAGGLADSTRLLGCYGEAQISRVEV